MFRKHLHFWLVGIFIILALIVALMWRQRAEQAPMPQVVQEKKIKIVTTILPLYLTAKEVGGQRVEVENLIPLSAQPWKYILTQEDAKRREGAQLFVRTGTPIDQWAEGLAGEYPGITELVLSEKLRLLPSLPLTAGGRVDKEADAYFWLDPGRMMEAAGHVRDALIAQEPNQKFYYWAQAGSYLETLSMLDRDFRERFKGASSSRIAASHNFLTYFVDSFALAWVGAGAQKPGEQPSAPARDSLRHVMQAKGVKALFSAPGDTWTEGFARAADATVYPFNPLEFATNTDINYDTVMRENMRVMSEALGYVPEME